MEPNFTPRSFELLAELEANNEKAWYDEHRHEFQDSLREPFAGVLEQVTERLEDTDVPLAGGAKTMFRQHRDIRFSKDKSPYSTHVSGVLTPSGTKAEKAGLVYVHLDSSGGMIACGFYQLKAADLAPLRDRILDRPVEFASVLKDLSDADLSLSDTDKLVTMPRGYGQYEHHQYADYLKLKSFVVQVSVGKGAWIEGDMVDCIVEYAKNCASLLAFGRAAQAASISC